ncbi:calcineurin-like phosphoesterase [Penicillium psychrosexuale]|uniref:calcineurin-like phosphoesterase n=1 Tax=Penicillium psychrosexuale TaxID=1002107 RepID=UPI0025455313|nr:calcineurin-like phosphoesterase [Penicillium psychrosexuale]KAJ5783746.1 calcineurin-like phosphoesterase [Penicillium psychrosexuale]
MMAQFIRKLFSQASVSIQLLSDLHLEVNQQYTSFDVPVVSKYLLLAGDIGRLADYDQYLRFLQRQTEKFELVFLVLGNHEFYGGSFESAFETARRLEQEPSLNGRLILLHQRRYDIPDSHVTILGCTLWSDIPENSRDIVHYKIQDFQKIKDWTVDEHNAAHKSDLNWLRNEVQSIYNTHKKNPTESSKRSILVATHHAPAMHRTSSPQHAKNPWSAAFATDLLSQPWNGVNNWVFGHTHYSTEFKERGIRVVSNQRGYILPWSNEANGFDAGKVIWV